VLLVIVVVRHLGIVPTLGERPVNGGVSVAGIEIAQDRLQTVKYLGADEKELAPGGRINDANVLDTDTLSLLLSTRVLGNRHDARNVIDQQFPLRQQLRPEQR
jgi:hypothetical protein